MSTVIDETGGNPPPPAEPTDGGDPRPSGGRSRSTLTTAVVAMLLVAAVLTVVIVAVSANSKDAATSDPYEITADTGASQQVRNGTDLVPTIIRLKPGQRIVLRNGDFQPHTIGDLTAGRGQTVAQTYATEGRYLLSTSLRPDGRVTVLVEAP